MKVKWFLAVVGVLLLALSAVLAAADRAAVLAASAAAGDRLEAARKAVTASLESAVTGMRDALAAGDGTAPPAHAWTETGLPPPDADVRTVAGTPVELRRDGSIDVRHVLPARAGTPREARVGRIPGDVVRARLAGAADAAAGPAAWSRMALVSAQGEPLLVAFAEGAPQGSLADDAALQRIGAGRPGSLDAADGRPPRYKGARNHQVLGVWGAAGAGSRLVVLVEVDEALALRDQPGLVIHWEGKDLARIKAWYVVLAAGLLTLLVSLFLVVASRYTEIGPLVRVYAYARPYAAGILVTIAAGATFAAAKAFQTYLLKRVADDVLVQQGDGAYEALRSIVWQTVGLGLVMALATFFKDYLQNYYSTAMVNDLRLAIGSRLVQLPMGFFHRMRTGDLNARIERDVAGLRILLNEVFEQGFTKPFQLVGALVAAFVMNPALACWLLGMPVIVFPLFRIARKIRKRAEKRQLLIADISHVLFQILSGIKIVKSFGGERREVERLADANHRYIRQVRKIQRLAALSKGLLDLLQMAGGAALVWFGGVGVLEGGVSLGDLMAFMLVVQLVYDAAKELTGTSNKVIEQTPAVLRVFEVLDSKDTLTDGPDELPRRALREGIELRGVRFRYQETDVLRGLDLTVPAGKVVALVGPTGAGKTTICDLVARLYDPTEGQVLVDGADIRRFTKRSLLRSIAVVTQDAFLFNTTVEENIRYGREGASREEIEAAARDAFVHDDILAMDGGYAKVCGERGTALSGGQRQRVTIARAILKDAPILILDEATSNLDSHSEAQVQAAMAKLMAGRTVIVVAHRLSTIRNADLVVVLDSGRIVEQGAPAELLARPHGRFRAMYDLQMGDGGDGGAAAPV